MSGFLSVLYVYTWQGCKFQDRTLIDLAAMQASISQIRELLDEVDYDD